MSNYKPQEFAEMIGVSVKTLPKSGVKPLALAMGI